MGNPMKAETEQMLEQLQRDAFGYFLDRTNLANGLVADNTRDNARASIAAVGMALASYPIGVERGFITREAAVRRILTTFRFFLNSSQGTSPNATGYRGFYYHFLDMQTGQRAGQSELSTIDTGCLLAGALNAAMYFDRDSKEERELRNLAHDLYGRTDWHWALNGDAALTHGWTPEAGFLPYRWTGYNEALHLYILGLGSPTHPIPRASYATWTSTYSWKKFFGYEFLYAGPFFIHQYSHLWLDLRGMQDEFMREKGVDYFENSRRAAYIQQQYAIHNPLEFKGYGECFWGITASDGPGPATMWVNGVERRFLDYDGRGVPYGPDDGTVSPWATIASLPFAPEIVLPTLQYFMQVYPGITGVYGCKSTVNPTFPDPSGVAKGWMSPRHFGLNQGPIVLMIENYRSGLPWRLARQCSYYTEGLRQAGFRGG